MWVVGGVLNIDAVKYAKIFNSEVFLEKLGIVFDFESWKLKFGVGISAITF